MIPSGVIGSLVSSAQIRSVAFDPLLDVTYNAASWWSADKETVYSDTNGVGAITDWGPSGRTLYSGGAAPGPYYRTNVINSKPALAFSASNFVTASQAQTDVFFRSNHQAVFIAFLETSPSANWWEKAFMACDEGGGPTSDKWIFSIDNNHQTVWHCQNNASQNCQFNGATNSVSASVWNIAGFTKSGTILNVYANGSGSSVNQTIVGYPTAIVAPYRVGWGEGTTSNTFTGYMAEILFYSASMSVADRQKIEGYLAWKYGLQGKLIGSHPYKTAAPTSTRTA